MSAVDEKMSPTWRPLVTAPMVSLVLLAAGLAGCAASSTPGAADARPRTDAEGGEESGFAAETSSAESDTPQSADGEAKSKSPAGEDVDVASAATGVAASSSLWDGREPEMKRALPEVTIRHIGMHLGGEPNTPEAKRPWLDDLEQGTVGYLQCYKLVHRPMTGGTFGVDVYVSTQGGTPEIRGTRQRLGEANFEQCMTDALLALEFHRPPRPTMISYSMRFDVKDAAP